MTLKQAVIAIGLFSFNSIYSQITLQDFIQKTQNSVSKKSISQPIKIDLEGIKTEITNYSYQSDNHLISFNNFDSNNPNKLYFNGSLGNCTNVYPDYSDNVSYNKGDTVRYIGAYYKAKEDVMGSNPQQGKWGFLIECIGASGSYFKFIDKASNVELLGGSNLTGYKTSDSKDFCNGTQVGIESDKETGFSIYPNPFNNQISIKTNQIKRGNYLVTDLNGKQLFIGQFEDVLFNLNLNELNVGVYFITLQSEKGFYSKKIIKK